MSMTTIYVGYGFLAVALVIVALCLRGSADRKRKKPDAPHPSFPTTGLPVARRQRHDRRPL
jgi:hypothetical protein